MKTKFIRDNFCFTCFAVFVRGKLIFYPVLFAECEKGKHLNTSSRKAGFVCVADILKAK